MEKTGTGNPSDHFVSKHDRQTLYEVRDRYVTLKELIQGLSVKLSNVSTSIEDEFLSAYRVHMLSVQQELRELKMSVTKAEEALNEDKQVAALEHEVTWFCDETTRLKNQASSMKKDMQHIIMRTDALREQRSFLGEQLKSTLKRSRILEAELKELTEIQFDETKSTNMSRTSRNALKSSASAATLPKGLSMEKSKSAPKFPSLHPKSKSRSSISLSRSASNDALISKPKLQTSDLQYMTVSPVDELETLKQSRLSIEIELENSIRGVLREIVDRKVATAARDMRLSLDDVKVTKPKLADIGGITGLGLEHFSDSDRLSAISMFLSQPSVFRKVVTCLNNEL